MLRQYDLKNYNVKLLLNVWLLSGLGILFINSANSSYTMKQLFGVALCSVIMLFLSIFDYNTISNNIGIVYIGNIFLLLLVLIPGVGKTVGGATRWLSFGGFTFQPSETCKIALILSAAFFISKHEDDLNEWKTLLKLAAVCLIPMAMVIKEPDLSTTIDITLILCAILFIGGLSLKLIGWVIAVSVPLFAAFIWYIQTPGQILLKAYQVKRIMTFINPSKYAATTAYQTNNSIMAIGSGQLFGKGLNRNTISDVTVTVRDTGLVSEQQTDFIFSVIGEEFGFIGSIIILLLLASLVVQCIMVAKKANDLNGKLIATGVAALIAFQSFINVGVATGLLPNTGLPLPLISYGLSSVLSIMVGMGMVLNISLQCKKY
jgi:rod shape determining protein RodA